MQKDVLIEVVANAMATISKRKDPTEPRNEDQRFLSNLIDEIYSTDPDKLDYPTLLDTVNAIKNKYTKLPIHNYYS